MRRTKFIPVAFALCCAIGAAALIVPTSSPDAASTEDAGAAKVTSSLLRSDFGYGVTEVSAPAPGDPDVGEVPFRDVPKDVCIYLASVDIGTGQSVSVNGKTLPIGDKAAAACRDGNDNVVKLNPAR